MYGEADVYIEFNGRFVASSCSWDRVDHFKALVAVRAMRMILGKPKEINGRKLNGSQR